ncbi:hypothetical protein [Sediminitomix flava]|uniref:Uncharacterized protein n=1 Tax=Sediminitomix flava TaxID=379075 RepID=A0A315ZHD2_SEDFL|nr:hypothetical protein [Sediminitomix flava]PWJ44931.1 hypothetical protein BC781_1011320 [Sediminitomix flava]
MSKSKIFAIIFTVVVVLPLNIFLGYLLINGVYEKITLDRNISESEARVIGKLKQIREIQVAYQERYGEYCNSWDTLTNFVKEDTIYTLEKREIIITKAKRQKMGDKNWWKGDSVRVEYDTIGRDQVAEKLFPVKKFPTFSADSIRYIPGKGEKQFELTAGKYKVSGVTVDVVEVKDPFPVDPTRKEDSPNRTRQFLRFGSQNSATVSGNWE